MLPYWLFLFSLLFQPSPTPPDALIPLTISSLIHPGEHSAVQFSPSGRYISRYPGGALSVERQQVEIWDSHTGEQVYHAEKVVYFHWINGTDQFYITFYDTTNYGLGESFVYDPDKAVTLTPIEGTAYQWELPSEWLIMYDDDKTWLHHAERPIQPIEITDSNYNQLVFSPTGLYIAVSDYDSLRIHTADTGEQISRIDQRYTEVTFNPDDTAFIARTLQEYHLYSIRPTLTEPYTQIEAQYRGCGAPPSPPQWFTEGTRILLTGSGIVWDYVEDSRTPLHGRSVLSPDGRWIATLNYVELTLYDANTLAPIQTWEDHYSHFSWSPNSRWLVTYGYDGLARLYDMEAPAFVQQMRHYQDFGACGVVLFAPQWNTDGSQLATYEFSNSRNWRAGDHGTIHLLEGVEGQPFYAQPDAEEPSGLLAHGTAFTLQEIALPYWYRFETDDGHSGWLMHDDLSLNRVKEPSANTIWVWSLPDNSENPR